MAEMSRLAEMADMSRLTEASWRDVLAERHCHDVVRDAVAKEIARTYASITTDPLPAELVRAMDELRRSERSDA